VSWHIEVRKRIGVLDALTEAGFAEIYNDSRTIIVERH
jgi:hypothetical protein